MATRVGWGKIWFAAFDGPIPKTPYSCKHIADIYDRSRVIAYFDPNFVAMATTVGEGKMWNAAFDGPTPKNSL